MKWVSDSGNNSLFGGVDSVGKGYYSHGHDDLQVAALTWGHKFNDRFHTITEGTVYTGIPVCRAPTCRFSVSHGSTCRGTERATRRGERSRSMAFVITEPCVGTCDTACVEACPVDCIWGPLPVEEIRAVPEAERRERFGKIQLHIDPTVCICCGACEPECPVSAIFDEDRIPERYKHFVSINARFFEERT